MNGVRLVSSDGPYVRLPDRIELSLADGALAYTLVGSIAEAEEIVQEGFVEVHRHFDEVRSTA